MTASRALAAALAAALAPACFATSYRCEQDSDCDVGELGRCEANHRCTVLDATCPVRRRYTEHSEELSGQCFDDASALANPCVGGQPPARPEGCLRDVCDALPACCETGWSDACVQAAQLRCELACDTRLAVTAVTASRAVELYDLRWTGTQWMGARILDRTAALAWLPPAPGQLEPRLAGVAGGVLVVGEERYPVDPGRTYHALVAVDFDRDGRDTVALAWSSTTSPIEHAIEIIKLDGRDGSPRRTLTVPRSQHLGWGDNDHDAFPDGIAGLTDRYTVLDNIEADEPTRARSLAASTSANIGGDPTPPAPPLRGFDWIDLDGDGRLELAVFGNQIRLHHGDVRLANNPVASRDCDPPAPLGQCTTPDATAFAGAALPSLGVSSLVAATFPAAASPGPRKVFQLFIDPRTPQLPSPPKLLDSCATCAPFIAMIARDLDGDHQLDLVGIDSRLRVHTARAAENHRFREQGALATGQTYLAVELSVSGTPGTLTSP